jgi:hypothetical protein
MQVGFFEVVAMPLFNSLVTAYSMCRPMLEVRLPLKSRV